MAEALEVGMVRPAVVRIEPKLSLSPRCRSARTLVSSRKRQFRSAASKRGEPTATASSTLANTLIAVVTAEKDPSMACQTVSIPAGRHFSSPCPDSLPRQTKSQRLSAWAASVLHSHVRRANETIDTSIQVPHPQTDTVCEVLLVQSGIAAIDDSDHTGTFGACLPGFGKTLSSRSRKTS